MSKLRLAIIGGGHLGRIHAKLAQANPLFNVVAVADPSSEIRANVQSQLGLSTVENHTELLGEIDAAIVATPTIFHYEITSSLLRSGVHCLVEKPLASSPDQSQRLVQIARNHRRVLQTGHVERFNPKWTTAIPHLGKPKFIEAVRCGTYSGRSTDIGVVMDLMIHDLDLILSLDHSPVERIDASGLALLGSHEDLAEARLTFASGLVANLRASRLAASGERRMQLYTTTCFADIDFSSEQLRLVRPTEEVLHRLVALDELPPAERLQAKDHIFEDYLTVETIAAPGRNAILDEHNDFALSIQTNSAPAVTGEDGARAVELASRIVKAIESRQWDGATSRSWQTGAHAMLQPRVIPLRATQSDHQSDSTRRAG